MSFYNYGAKILFFGLANRVPANFSFGYALRRLLAGRVVGRLGPDCSIGPNVYINDSLYLSEGANVGAGCRVLADGGVYLGARLKMGPDCMFITGDHPIPRGEQTFSDLKGSSRSIVIGDDCFIGARSLILPGVNIGSGVAVGAGSVVTKDVPSNCVVAGVPARIVKSIG